MRAVDLLDEDSYITSVTGEYVVHRTKQPFIQDFVFTLTPVRVRYGTYNKENVYIISEQQFENTVLEGWTQETIDSMLREIRLNISTNGFTEEDYTSVRKSIVESYIGDWESETNGSVSATDYSLVQTFVDREYTQAGVFSSVWGDDDVSEISVRSNTVYVVRDGDEYVTNIRFQNQQQAWETIQFVLENLGITLSETHATLTSELYYGRSIESLAFTYPSEIRTRAKNSRTNSEIFNIKFE